MNYEEVILGEPLIAWYQEHKRALPWRMQTDPYRIWVSEIMLQQTRAETAIAYYERFVRELPTIQDLAKAPEDKLFKLWEGLGYYNRVRNMKKAAIQIMVDYDGIFPGTFEEIRSLKGIGSYTAGAVSSIAFGIPKPAVDGNVLRVIARLTGNGADIKKQSTRKEIERSLEKVIVKYAAGDFNQALMELGALVCIPNGQPKCTECPLALLCIARKEGRTLELPVKTKAKARRIEERTVLVFKDGETVAIAKRKQKGLLAGLYELPNVERHLSMDEVAAYCKDIGLMPVYIKSLPDARHIFSHVEWHMKGYLVKVDEFEKTNKKDFLFVPPAAIREKYPIPSAFDAYMPAASPSRESTPHTAKTEETSSSSAIRSRA